LICWSEIEKDILAEALTGSLVKYVGLLFRVKEIEINY
jgi:hypothetical protein